MFQPVLQLCLIFRAALGRLLCFLCCPLPCSAEKVPTAGSTALPECLLPQQALLCPVSFTFPGKIFSRNLRTKCPLLVFIRCPPCTSSIGAMPSSCCRYAAIRLCSADVHAAGRITSTFSARTVCSVRVSVISSFTFVPKRRSHSAQRSASSRSCVPARAMSPYSGC